MHILRDLGHEQYQCIRDLSRSRQTNENYNEEERKNELTQEFLCKVDIHTTPTFVSGLSDTRGTNHARRS